MTRPVSRSENQGVHGMALSCDRVHEMDMERIRSLRKRHADYEASLPSDPKEAISAACTALHAGPTSFLVDFEEALHLSHALSPMLKSLQVDDCCEALLWVMDRISAGLERAAEKVQHIEDILSRPAIVEFKTRRT